MANRLIMEVHVTLDQADCTSLRGPAGGVNMVPFGGTVDGPLFEGRVCPGGVDCQRVNLVGIMHMCARYMMEGKDHTGAPCHVFVENNGWMDTKERRMVFETVPTFFTDSEALAPYLHQNRFRGEGHPCPGGVTIQFYDVLEQAE